MFRNLAILFIYYLQYRIMPIQKEEPLISDEELMILHGEAIPDFE